MAHLFLHTPNEQLHVWEAVSQAPILPGSPRTTCFSPLHCLAASPSTPGPQHCLSAFTPAPLLPCISFRPFLSLNNSSAFIPFSVCIILLFDLLGVVLASMNFKYKSRWKKIKECFCFCFYSSVVFCWSPPQPPPWLSGSWYFKNIAEIIKWFIPLPFGPTRKVPGNVLVDRHQKAWISQSLLKQNWYLKSVIRLSGGELLRLLEWQYFGSRRACACWPVVSFLLILKRKLLCRWHLLWQK